MTNSAITGLELFIRRNNIDIVLLNATFLKSYHKFCINRKKSIKEIDKHLAGES